MRSDRSVSDAWTVASYGDTACASRSKSPRLASKSPGLAQAADRALGRRRAHTYLDGNLLGVGWAGRVDI
jgi:hypothetical protein